TVFLSICRFFAAVVLTLFGVFLRTTIGMFGGVDEDVITPLHSSHQRLSSAIAFVQSPLSPSPRTQPPGGLHGLRQAATSGKALTLTKLRWLDCAGMWAIHLEGKMRAKAVAATAHRGDHREYAHVHELLLSCRVESTFTPLIFFSCGVLTSPIY